MMQNSLVIPKDSAKIDASLLLSKLSKLLVGLIIFFSATQFGLHFWPLSSLVYGIRIDYLAPTIYFLDCLILMFFVIRRSDLVGCKPNQKPTRSDLVGVIVPILLTNLLYSQNPLATLSWSFHFLLYFAFIAILGSDLKGSAQPADSKAGRLDPKVVIRTILTLSLLFQSILATGQVIMGRSVGGLLYYLGERSIAVGSPAVALATFMDRVVLRAYGTFGHPNVLAGYAVISLLIILQLSPVIRRSDPVGCKPNQKPTRSDLIGVIVPPLLTTLLVFLTQSRSAAISLFGLIIPCYLIKNLRSRIVYFCIVALVYLYIFPTSLTPTRTDLSSSQRLTLQGLSLSVVESYPVFGTGAQASISTYPQIDPNIRLLQPDHNSFTLILSWFGVFGVLAILSIITRLVPLRGIIAGLPLLLLDHYLLTSPQGLFIIMLYYFLLSPDYGIQTINLQHQ